MYLNFDTMLLFRDTGTFLPEVLFPVGKGWITRKNPFIFLFLISYYRDVPLELGKMLVSLL